jgi:hypothetical protein
MGNEGIRGKGGEELAYSFDIPMDDARRVVI